MSATWFTDTPELAPHLNELLNEKGTTWQIAIGESNRLILLSVQSAEMPDPRVIDITSQLDELIIALQDAKIRLGQNVQF